MKFVHAADLHVDSPLVGLERYEGAPVEELRQATRRAVSSLVTLCIQASVQALVLAGDLFDGEWRDYSTGLFFVGQMQRLRQADVRVIIAKGNHDAQSQVTQKLSLPDNVFEFGTEAAQSFVYPEGGLVFHGQSYAHRAEYRDLAAGYPAAVPGLVNVGVLHTCATGRPGHEAYAPCRLSTLIDKRYDYWALGHVHEREVLHENPWIVFPGNLQARHMKETGPKGATLVEYDATGVTKVQHRVLDVVRFARLEVAVSDAVGPDDVVDACFDAVHGAWQEAQERGLVVRVRANGHTKAHQALHRDLERWHAELRARANELPGVWVERCDFGTQPAHAAAEVEKRADALGQTLRALSELRNDPAARLQLLTVFDDLRAKLPPDVKKGGAGIDLDDPDVLLEVIGEVESLFESTLYPQGDA